MRKPPPPPEVVEEGEPPLPLPPPTGPGLDQGAVALVIDTLTPDRFTPVVTEAEEERIKKESKLPAPPPGPLLGAPALQSIARRWYVTVGINHRGRKGPPSNRAPVLLSELPPTPAAPTVTYTAELYTVTWAVPPGARESIQEPVLEKSAAAAGAGVVQPEAPGNAAGRVPDLVPAAPSGVTSPSSGPQGEEPARPEPAALTPPAAPTRPSEETPAAPTTRAGQNPSAPPACSRRSTAPLEDQTIADESVAELFPPPPPAILTGRPGFLFQPIPASTYNVYEVTRESASPAPASND